jgi:hypothetical protein
MGCSLRSVHEASDYFHFPTFVQKRRSRLSEWIDDLDDPGRLESEWDCKIASDKRKVNPS